MALLSLAAYWIGQANDNSTGTHPPPSGGTWASGQRWSTTSAQWQAAYNDMVLQRDSWQTSALTWQNAANSLWGPSRVYNSGSTWETLYNNEVALYNDMVNQRNTWIANYNAVLPPTPGAVEVAASGSRSSSGEVCRITTNRAGYWAVVFRGSCHNDGNASPGGASMNTGDSVSWDAGGDQGMDGPVGLLYFGILGNGAVVTVTLNDGGGGNSMSGTLHAYFCSTSDYPH